MNNKIVYYIAIFYSETSKIKCFNNGEILF